MPTTKSLKAAEKTVILKKLVTELKKRYGGKVPKDERPVLETLLYSACLEDTDHTQAQAAYDRMLNAFFDLNEIRVSSVTEIENSLGELNNADWKAMRLRESLQHTFEKHFAFDLDGLRRKTQDAASKELAEISFQTSFMRTYTIAHSLGAHVLPIDESMRLLLVWLGLADHKATAEKVADDLKSAVKKSDGALICFLLKAAATDEKLRWAFEGGLEDDAEIDPKDAAKRLAALIKNPKPPKKKAPAKKAAASKSSTKKPAGKKTAAKKAPAKKSPAKKAAAKKTTKKKTVKKPAAKKAATKRSKKKATTAKKKVTRKKPTAKKATKRKKK